MKNLFYLFLSSIILLTGFSSCNDGTETLSLGYNGVYAKLGEDVNLYIYSGNGGYEISIDNEAYFTASEKNGMITVKPLAIGKGVITVTDKENQVAKISITVTQPYMAFGVAEVTIESNVTDEATKKGIQDDLEKNMILKKGYIYDLTRTDSHPFTSYKEWWNASPDTNGNYEFATSSSSDSLKLTTTGASFGYAMEQKTDAKIFYDYFVSNKTAEFSTSNPVFNLTADLTEKYKKEYPDKDIKSVKVTAVVQVFPYRLN